MSAPARAVQVTGFVRLGPFLKLSGAVDSGADAREVLLTGQVTVNGDAEERRGRQLADGDVVGFGPQSWRVRVTG